MLVWHDPGGAVSTAALPSSGDVVVDGALHAHSDMANSTRTTLMH